MERSVVVTKTEDNRVERNADTLEESDAVLDLCQIGVCLNNITDEGVFGVPDTVKIIRHEIYPVGVGQQPEEIEVLKIPVGRGRGEREAKLVT